MVIGFFLSTLITISYKKAYCDYYGAS